MIHLTNEECQVYQNKLNIIKRLDSLYNYKCLYAPQTSHKYSVKHTTDNSIDALSVQSAEGSVVVSMPYPDYYILYALHRVYHGIADRKMIARAIDAMLRAHKELTGIEGSDFNYRMKALFKYGFLARMRFGKKYTPEQKIAVAKEIAEIKKRNIEMDEKYALGEIADEDYRHEKITADPDIDVKSITYAITEKGIKYLNSLEQTFTSYRLEYLYAFTNDAKLLPRLRTNLTASLVCSNKGFVDWEYRFFHTSKNEHLLTSGDGVQGYELGNTLKFSLPEGIEAKKNRPFGRVVLMAPPSKRDLNENVTFVTDKQFEAQTEKFFITLRDLFFPQQNEYSYTNIVITCADFKHIEEILTILFNIPNKGIKAPLDDFIERIYFTTEGLCRLALEENTPIWETFMQAYFYMTPEGMKIPQLFSHYTDFWGSKDTGKYPAKEELLKGLGILK